MNIIEFLSNIENGVIHIPTQYKGYENSYVKVTLQIQKPKQGQKDRLKSIFQKLQKTQFFSKIENPVSWQKNIRDKWD